MRKQQQTGGSSLRVSSPLNRSPSKEKKKNLIFSFSFGIPSIHYEREAGIVALVCFPLRSHDRRGRLSDRKNAPPPPSSTKQMLHGRASLTFSHTK